MRHWQDCCWAMAMVVVAQRWHGDALPLSDPLLIDSYGFTLLTLPSLVAQQRLLHHSRV